MGCHVAIDGLIVFRPAYQLTEKEIIEVQGPRLAAAVARLKSMIVPED
jgi:hypothetical protein